MPTLGDIGMTALLVVEVFLATLVFCVGTEHGRVDCVRPPLVIALVAAVLALVLAYEPLQGMGLPLAALPWVVLACADLLLVRLVRDVSWLEALVVATLGYCLHHIGSDVVSLVSFFASEPAGPFGVVFLPTRYLMLASVFLLCWAVVGRNFRVDAVRVRSRRRWIAFCCVALVATIALELVFIVGRPPEIQATYYVYDLLSSTLIMAMMVVISRIERLSDSLSAVELLWEQKRAQYELTKENIELINIKCHDIRNRISKAGELNGMLAPETLREITDSIRVYDSSMRTGNKTLDIVLTEKRLRCSESGIELSCMADGALLSGIPEDDLYFLMDNILRNAIEAARELADPEKRVINLTVTAAGPMVRIYEENYFDGVLAFVDGLPRSTKGDDANHGFGMRSIRHIVNKYAGNLAVSAHDGVFSLSILLPQG